MDSIKIGTAKIEFKCGEDVACLVKKMITTYHDPNLQIHFLTNCIKCNGRREPEPSLIN